MKEHQLKALSVPELQSLVRGLQLQTSKLEEQNEKLRQRLESLQGAETEQNLRTEYPFISFFGGNERRLLESFLRSPDKLLRREDIFDQLYGHIPSVNWPDKKIIDVYVTKLRRKLEQHAPGLIITTQWGLGYMLRKNELSEELSRAKAILYKQLLAEGISRKDQGHIQASLIKFTERLLSGDRITEYEMTASSKPKQDLKNEKLNALRTRRLEMLQHLIETVRPDQKLIYNELYRSWLLAPRASGAGTSGRPRNLQANPLPTPKD